MSGKGVSEMGVCLHYWLVEPPRGASSDAACKLCGETAVFSNRESDPYMKRPGRQPPMLAGSRTRSAKAL